MSPKLEILPEKKFYEQEGKKVKSAHHSRTTHRMPWSVRIPLTDKYLVLRGFFETEEDTDPDVFR